MCVCMYVCICTYILFIYSQKHMDICYVTRMMYICVYIRTYVCMYMHMYIAYIFTEAYGYILCSTHGVYACMYECMHECMCECKRVVCRPVSALKEGRKVAGLCYQVVGRDTSSRAAASSVHIAHACWRPRPRAELSTHVRRRGHKVGAAEVLIAIVGVAVTGREIRDFSVSIFRIYH